MRVADAFRFQVYTSTLSTLEAQMDNATTQIASGKKVNVPSDDPASYAQNLQITAELSQNTQYGNNLNSLQTTASYYNTSLNTISNVLTSVEQLVVQQSSSTVDANSRSTAAGEVNDLIQQLVTVGNTKVGDTYIFGGKNSNEAPYTLDSSTNSVTFNGTNDVAKVAVDSSSTVDAGISGNTVFTGTADGQSVNIFDTLQQLSQDLQNNDTTALQTDLTNVDACVDLTANNLSYVGTYTKNITNLLNANATANTTLT
ncbi:MAG: flagellar hook-associated protein FlgL, partial [Syntrophorhabdales bacterium]